MEDTQNQPTNNPIRIPVVVDADFDPNELVGIATKQLLDTRKGELSSQIVKLFHKADGLAEKKQKAEKEAQKAEEQLTKVLGQIEKLKAGDWSVLNKLDQE